MLEHGRDAYICNVASIAAYAPAPNFAVYSGTKHYVRVFSEVLNIELKGTRVSVTCLCPGGTLTEFMETNGQKLKPGASLFMMTSETVARMGLKATLKRKGVKVTGFLNVLATTLPRLVPGWLGIRAAHLAMKGNVELADPSAKHLPGTKS
jgi:short-subunit dehydrogenase